MGLVQNNRSRNEDQQRQHNRTVFASGLEHVFARPVAVALVWKAYLLLDKTGCNSYIVQTFRYFQFTIYLIYE